jgi:RNA polymerase sigma-70 factor (ECF subfamily)
MASKTTTRTSTSVLEGLRDPANHEVWQKYVDRYRPIIVRFATAKGLVKEDAEDVAQETLLDFCRAYRAGRYDRDRGRLRAWLFGIAQREIGKWRERRRGIAGSGSSDAAALIEDLATPDVVDEVWEREWHESVLEECLRAVQEEVQPRTFEAFELFALKAWPARKVADTLGITENAVFLAKSRILRRIRELVPVMDDNF